jgi:hypothetical protein
MAIAEPTAEAEPMADQRTHDNTSANKSHTGQAGDATSATTPPTTSHNNEIEDQGQTADDKQDTSSTSTESPGGGAGKQAGSNPGRR